MLSLPGEDAEKPSEPPAKSQSPATVKEEKPMDHDYKHEKHAGGVVVEQHDHDHNYGGHGMPGYGYDGAAYGGHTWGIWGIFAFIAFIVIIWAVWGFGRRMEEHHNRDNDKHHDNQRCIDKIGYEMGYTRKELNDMQHEIRVGLAKEDKIYDRMCYENEQMLRFGTPYGEHTQRLCTAKPAYCGEHRERHGGVINGSQLSDTRTFAVDHSVI